MDNRFVVEPIKVSEDKCTYAVYDNAGHDAPKHFTFEQDAIYYALMMNTVTNPETSNEVG